MNAVKVTEVVANQGRSSAFTTSQETLGIARQTAEGLWTLRLSNGLRFLCQDFDEMRQHILDLLPGHHGFFERRRIRSRRSLH